MSRAIITTVVSVAAGDRIRVYEGPVGQGQWREGVVSARAAQDGPGGGVCLFWLDDADLNSPRAAVMVRSGREVTIIETAEARQLQVVTDERDQLLAQVEWLTGCPDGCNGSCADESDRVIETVAVAGGRL